MGLVELTMPALGEGIIEATVLRWLKNVGETVEEEDPILEIATDKVDSEVPSTVSGTIKELRFKENDIARIGDTIAIIETTGENSNTAQQTQPAQEEPLTDKAEAELAAAVPYAPAAVHTESRTMVSHNPPGESNNGFYSPLVLSIAKEEGISADELSRIPGTGKDNRLSKNDLLDYVSGRKNDPPAATQENIVIQPVMKQVPQITQPPKQSYSVGGNTEIIEMDRMRKLIAHHMKESQNISATVTVFAETDVTNMVHWRDKIKHEFEKREHTKITFTPMFFECVARAIRRFPLINSSVDGDKIIVKKDINIGMATALPSGNLIVPVIKNVDHLNIVGLAKAINTVAHNARNNQLKPSDTQDGTFTITNVGSFGSLTGTPIINQPQVAILAIGTIKKKPVVIETAHGDTIGIRSMMIVSLSFDHRVIDGALGSTFLNEVVKEIEGWDINRKW